MSAESIIKSLLQKAGIEVNGTRPFDPIIHNPHTYKRVLTEGSLGLGEAYMDGWWDCQQIDELIARITRTNLDKSTGRLRDVFGKLKARLMNLQSVHRAKIVGEQHYDVGNDLYKAMLDPTMTYSCGYWKNAKTLEQAQLAKLDLCCKKLALKKGMRILDIGCGWGSFAIHAAKTYGVEVVGLTVSKEQAALAREKSKGLPITITMKDYRSVEGTFDRVVSIGMFEHVGYKNYGRFMNVVKNALKKDGLALLHTMGTNITTTHNDPFYDKYIFPNGMVPSIQQIGTAMEGKLVMEDWHNFGLDYDKTLMAWHANFIKAWPELKKQYNERFKRMWEYYLLSFAGAFRSKRLQLWQIVMSEGILTSYASVR